MITYSMVGRTRLRFGVDYNVPEPATTGLLMGLAFLAVILYRHIRK